MAEYIERQAAIDAINHELRCGAMADQCGLETAFELLCELPPADVRPVVRGRWEKDSDGLYICSECGEVALQRVFIKLPKKIVDLQMVQSAFCPHCGVDMREEESTS